MDEDKLDRVAETIWRVERDMGNNFGNPRLLWGDLEYIEKKRYRSIARAALITYTNSCLAEVS